MAETDEKGGGQASEAGDSEAGNQRCAGAGRKLMRKAAARPVKREIKGVRERDGK